MRRPGVAQMEALLSYLKLLLINASRMKMDRRAGPSRADASGVTVREPEILVRLKAAIEEHFATLHSPGDYAGLLNISTAALNKVVKGSLHKTLSQLIAFELGYDDEFYFSRFFKGSVGVSPQLFRDKVGFDRANA
jgi:AraC family transcriptional regulator, transcriptional activator of pobA